jgi:hypothetical protein
MRLCDAAIAVLRETDNPAVMFGDEGLLHQIAERAGAKSRGRAWETSAAVLAALSKTPGELVPGHVRDGRGRRVRIFRLPTQEGTDHAY